MKAEIIWLFKGICFFRESVAVKYENGLIKSWFQHFSRNKS